MSIKDIIQNERIKYNIYLFLEDINKDTRDNQEINIKVSDKLYDFVIEKMLCDYKYKRFLTFDDNVLKFKDVVINKNEDKSQSQCFVITQYSDDGNYETYMLDDYSVDLPIKLEPETVYISLPITNQESTLFERNLKAFDYICKNYPNINPISPVDINELTEDNLNEARDWKYYLGRDVEALLNCDAIYMAEGWQNQSKGCLSEFEIARVYEKVFLK